MLPYCREFCKGFLTAFPLRKAPYYGIIANLRKFYGREVQRLDIKIHYIIDFAVLAVIYILFYFKRLKSRDNWYKLVFTLTYIYLSLVLFVTLMPFQFFCPNESGIDFNRVNFIPFNDLSLGHYGAEREAVLNIIMFMPLGFLLPNLKKRGFFKIFFTSLGLTLFIEVNQLLYNWSGSVYERSFDVTDLINNTIGGILGFLCYLLFRPLLRRLRELVNGN